MKRAFITGITGQDGIHLAKLLICKGYDVHGLVRRTSFENPRSELLRKMGVVLLEGDLSDQSSLNDAVLSVQPSEVYNLAAQSHVAHSFIAPSATMDITGIGTLRLLQACRATNTIDDANIKFYQASSSEMFGGLEDGFYNEESKFHPRSPYAAAKVLAHHACVNYREAYGMHISCGILFNHECVTANTPIVIRKNGVLDICSIEEIVPHRTSPKYGRKYQTDGQGKLEIWDGGQWTKIHLMTATWNDGQEDKNVKCIVTRSGMYRATEDHLSFLQGGHTQLTGNLKQGQHLEIRPLPKNEDICVCTLEEAEFLGMLVADGCVKEARVATFTKNDDSLRQRVDYLWRQIHLGKSIEQEGSSGFSSKKVKHLNLSGNPEACIKLDAEIYNEDRTKRVPKRILNASKEIQMAFLKSYNKCDGLKSKRLKSDLQSLTTNSSVLAAGLWFLLENNNYTPTLCPEFRDGRTFYHINIRSDQNTLKGRHLQKSRNEIKIVRSENYVGWLFDLETESKTFSCGVGNSWVHNSPYRGETFVTRKISKAVATIKHTLDLNKTEPKKLVLGNLDACRDWGYAPEYVEGMWMMLQQEKPDDYVLATGTSWSVREFCEFAFSSVGLKWEDWVEVSDEFKRPSEVHHLLGDYSKARKILKWRPRIFAPDLAKLMVEYDLKELEGA